MAFVKADKRVGQPESGKAPMVDQRYPGGYPPSVVAEDEPETTVVPET